MYETEVNGMIESAKQIGPEVLARFSELTCTVSSRTVLPWSEHCTECVWPTCYSTCDLYEPRLDEKCRRFVNGMVRIPFPESTNSYVLKISFKRWAKLWAIANMHLYPNRRAQAIEIRDQRIGTALRILPLPRHIKKYMIGKRYGYKKKWAGGLAPSATLPDCFLVECFNPYDASARITLSMRSSGESNHLPFEKLMEMKPGFNRIRVPLHEIMAILKTGAPFNIELTPNDIENGMTLYFGLMEFVTESPSETSRIGSAKDKVATFKCVVWDIDNTLWEGTLVEDGPERLCLRPGIREVIEELDTRGILHSIASKNNADEAFSILKKLGLGNYFLYPQISWGPKSEGIKAIARHLNIGLDAIVFIDDSEFELAEVNASCPEVRLLKADDYLLLPEMKECQVPITDESRNRRTMYQAEAVRQSAAAEFGGNYLAFLRNAQMKLKIEPLIPSNLDRVHELTQRTNQMNFSGNRYERGTLQQVLDATHLDTYVLSCQDRFGNYGIIGFSIVDKLGPRMIDLMFSCRVQSKRVEHAFLAYILERYRHETGKDFYVNYRRTPKNLPAGRVFDDMGLEAVSEKEGVISLLFRKDREIPDDKIVDVFVNQIDSRRRALG